MQKKKQVFTWPISVLVIVVSFLSVLVVLQQVQAAWVGPSYLPESTTLNDSFVFTPLAEDLILNGKSITGTGNISITGVLSVNGVPVTGGGGGGGSSSNDWAINYSADRALHFTTTTGSGNVGIGTTTPATKLHIHDGASGPIVTLSGLNTNYKGLTIKNELGTEQWFAGSNTSNNYVLRRNGATDYFNVNANTGNINVAQDLSVGGNLTVAGTINGASGGAATSDWAILNGSLYYTTSTGNGKVGIGTNAPNKLLHLYSGSPNAELDIQSTPASGSHWAMYHDAGTDQLRFWKSAGNDVLTLGANGRVAVGTTPDNSNMVRSVTATAGVVGIYGENNSIDWSFLPNLNPNNVGVKGVAEGSSIGGIGVYGYGYHGVKGVGGDGGSGVYAEAGAGGSGIYATSTSAGTYAAIFDGEVLFKGNARVELPGYLTISNGIGSPTVGDCGTYNYGRVYIDRQNFRFYVCTGLTGWKSVQLN